MNNNDMIVWSCESVTKNQTQNNNNNMRYNLVNKNSLWNQKKSLYALSNVMFNTKFARTNHTETDINIKRCVVAIFYLLKLLSSILYINAEWQKANEKVQKSTSSLLVLVCAGECVWCGEFHRFNTQTQIFRPAVPCAHIIHFDHNVSKFFIVHIIHIWTKKLFTVHLTVYTQQIKKWS